MFKCYLFKEAFQDILYELTIPPTPNLPNPFPYAALGFWGGKG